MFLFSLTIQTLPFNNLIFGSAHDTSMHSLFIQVLIENKQIPVTVQPYLDEGIVYPQGFSAIAAYSVLILNYLPPQAVFYLTPLFNALAVLGAYFLGKTLSRKWNLGLSLAFVFAFVAPWPKYITWGSNALVASFPLYFICLSFLPFLTRGKLKVEAIFAIGILFGYLSVLHLQTYQTLVASLFILWLYTAIKEDKARWRKLLNLIAILGLSLLILSPFIYRYFAFYPYPYHNIGLPADVEYQFPQTNFSYFLAGVTWMFEHLASNTPLRIASLVLFSASVLAIVNYRRKKSFTQISRLTVIGVANFLGQSLIIVLGAISPHLPFTYQPMLLYISFYFFIGAFVFVLYYFLSFCLSKEILVKSNKPKLETKKLLVTTISLMLFLGACSPFLYQSIILDAGSLCGSYAGFSVTTEQDLQLILWVRDNLPRNAVILINNFQSGTFIPSIANRKVLWPFFVSSSSVSYRKLVALLEGNIINATTFDLMKRFNITNIFVASGVGAWDNWGHRWNPKLFLGNPNFKFIKNFGDAYLFQFNYTNPNIVFFDDFEHANWNETGWQAYFDGNGLGNVTITSFRYNDSRRMKITAQAIYTSSEWQRTSRVLREIFVQNYSDVTLSFYLNATEGFHKKLPFNDTFAVFVSNIYRNQSLVFTTPNGIFKDYSSAIVLNGSDGSFSFDLSSEWREKFSSSLPSTFILEFVNYDFDGVKNVAYVDNITVASTPSSTAQSSKRNA
jgi:hypothetical protein